MKKSQAWLAVAALLLISNLLVGGQCQLLPHPSNALLSSSGALVPLYPVSEPGRSVRSVGFQYDGETLTALSAQEVPLWSKPVGAGQLFGGFDFDQDGWPDLGLVRSQAIGGMCGATPLQETWITFYRGKSGAAVGGVAPLPDICWTFQSESYPTHQWTPGSVLFGPNGSTILLSPYYASTSWFFTWDPVAEAFTSEHLYYPSTPSFDAKYWADQLNPYGTGTSYIQDSHVANGLLLDVLGSLRAVFFTSARVAQYSVAPYSPGQLVLDRPFLVGGRTDLAGRNYGLVARDPQDPTQLAIVAGTSAYTVYLDRVNGTIGADEWGGIERHVSLYDLTTNGLQHRFYSNAHDNDDGNKYQGRIVYPDQVFAKDASGSPSRLAYNEYSNGHWYLHISQPGSTLDHVVLQGLFLWDIRDLDMNGVEEWVISPTEYPEDQGSGGYMPKWRTDLYHWNGTTQGLELVTRYEDRIPELVASFRQPERTSSWPSLYPALTVVQGNRIKLATRTSAGDIELVDLP